MADISLSPFQLWLRPCHSCNDMQVFNPQCLPLGVCGNICEEFMRTRYRYECATAGCPFLPVPCPIGDWGNLSVERFGLLSALLAALVQLEWLTLWLTRTCEYDPPWRPFDSWTMGMRLERREPAVRCNSELEPPIEHSPPCTLHTFNFISAKSFSHFKARTPPAQHLASR